ncbi:MAG: hypothetical protein WCK67_03140 [bacterium]
MNKIQVRDLMRFSANFVSKNNTLFYAFEAMKKSCFGEILVVNQDFSILGNIEKDTIKSALKVQLNDNIAAMKKTKLNELDIDYSFPVVLYPKMEIEEAYSLMSYMSKKYLPVVSAPWDKKVIGFLWISDLVKTLDKNTIKITG